MCTVVFLRRPGHRWPLLIAANRDEMADRPWQAPARHWPDRPGTVAGLDILAGGTWLGINDRGVVAAILNRIGTLGPAPGKRSRGELPLAALDHGSAASAAATLSALDPEDYRPFNMVVADAVAGFWLRCWLGDGLTGQGMAIDTTPLPDGLSMLTAYDLNDPASARTRRYRPLFTEVSPPDPDLPDWRGWETLLASTDSDVDAGPGGAMLVMTDTGFGTVCSSLLAVPSKAPDAPPPVWQFAAGRPGEVPFLPVSLGAPGQG